MTKKELLSALAQDEELREREGESDNAKPAMNAAALAMVLDLLADRGVPADVIAEANIQLKNIVTDPDSVRSDEERERGEMPRNALEKQQHAMDAAARQRADADLARTFPGIERIVSVGY